MQDGRLQAEEQVRQLTEETNARAARIQAMIKDFESMKNELMESNAEKDQYIDELNREIAGLNDRLNQQLESFQEKNFVFGFERERLSETVEERSETIRSLETRIEAQEEEISRQSSVLSDRNVRIGTLNDQLSLLEAEKERDRQRLEELQQQLKNSQEEVTVLQEQIKAKDETITRLENNVNLLKRELGNG
jgi:chromosome segregation ATPase